MCRARHYFVAIIAKRIPRIAAHAALRRRRRDEVKDPPSFLIGSLFGGRHPVDPCSRGFELEIARGRGVHHRTTCGIPPCL